MRACVREIVPLRRRLQRLGGPTNSAFRVLISERRAVRWLAGWLAGWLTVGQRADWVFPTIDDGRLEIPKRRSTRLDWSL